MTVLNCGPNDCDVIEADEQSRVHVASAHAHALYVKVQADDGSIHLYPVEHLSDGEQAVFRSESFLASTLRGLDDLKEGRIVSADWLFDDDE